MTPEAYSNGFARDPVEPPKYPHNFGFRAWETDETGPTGACEYCGLTIFEASKECEKHPDFKDIW